MKQGCLTATVLLVILVLAGCKTNVTLEVYSSDLSKVGEDSLTTPGTLAIEIPSANECDKYSVQISEIMKGLVEKFDPRGCKQVEMESFLNAAIEVPFVAGWKAWESMRTLFGVVSWKGKQGTAISVAMNRDSYRTLNDRMDRKFHQKLKIEKSKVTVIFHNDEKTDRDFRTGATFVDGQPVSSAVFSVRRRDKSTIELSNVHSALLAKTGRAVVFMPLPNN